MVAALDIFIYLLLLCCYWQDHKKIGHTSYFLHCNYFQAKRHQTGFLYCMPWERCSCQPGYHLSALQLFTTYILGLCFLPYVIKLKCCITRRYHNTPYVLRSKFKKVLRQECVNCLTCLSCPTIIAMSFFFHFKGFVVCSMTAVLCQCLLSLTSPHLQSERARWLIIHRGLHY